MIILPAIDIKDGQCVRLTKGDFATAEKVAGDPLETALSFQEAGAEWIHMVDLDGAKEGSLKNSPIFLKVAQNTRLKVELGGGIRTMESIDYYLERGISRVIIGSAAISDPEMVRAAVRKYGEKIAVGIDARNGMVSGGGWLQDSDIAYLGPGKENGRRRRKMHHLYRYFEGRDSDWAESGTARPNQRRGRLRYHRQRRDTQHRRHRRFEGNGTLRRDLREIDL